MERASEAFVHEFEKLFENKEQSVSVFCGTGNNGGDGLVIARLLKARGWNVQCYLTHFLEKFSEDNQTNQSRLADSGVELHRILNSLDLPETNPPIIIDALVGTGISRELTGLLAEVVVWINKSNATVCSVDLPSGLFDRGDCSAHLEHIVHADYTFTFQVPKRNFLLPDCADVVGKWRVLDIGMDEDLIKGLSCDEFLVSANQVRSLLKPRKPFSHKGTYGHAALVCGSKGMIGAAVLSTSACLRSGAGLTTIFTPECGYKILQTTCPEAMSITIGENHLNRAPTLDTFSSVGVGPGLGNNPETKTTLLEILKSNDTTMVLDADALNLLSETDLKLLPKHSILTPHPKEFERLFGKTNNSTERLELARTKSKEYSCVILLKGRYSMISFPDGTLYFNPTGNPGMAKGGSGDVLTGLITGLLARGYNSEHATILGCYLHGLAGDLTAEKIGMEGMKAGDLIEAIPEAFFALND